MIKTSSLVKTLALTGFVIASTAYSVNPAQAASFTYNWSFSGLANTSGTFVADDATGLLSSISGQVNGETITALGDPTLYLTDNQVPLTASGTAFLSASGAWNFYNTGTGSDLLFSDSSSTTYSGTFSYSPTAVPEPLTILGAATAAGLGTKFKRHLTQLKQSKKDA